MNKFPSSSGNRPAATLRIFCFVALAMFGTERQAHAYTDPGTGALLWQMALSIFASALFYSRKITSWLRSRRGPRVERRGSPDPG